MFKSLIKMLA